MKICKIQIQLTAKDVFLTKLEQAHRERAAIEEIYMLIPILRDIHGALPSVSVGAIGDHIFLNLSILAGSGLKLDVGKWSNQTRRVLEIDDSLATQIELKECIQLTQLLLVKAAFNEPDYIRLYRERFDARVKGKFANQFRKELGNRFSMFVEDAPHWIQKPLLPTQYVENYLRKFQLTVQHMYRNKKFDCNAIAELYITPLSHHFYPDARATFACTRVLGARSFSHGQILHRSMESGLPVEALGRLVIDDHSGDVIALQIEEVCDVIDEGIDDDQ